MHSQKHRRNKHALHSSRPGALLVEVLMGIVLFGLFATAVGVTIFYGQEGTIIAGDRIRASYLTRQALIAARSMRDASFASVTEGEHGVGINGSGVWSFSGTSVTHTQGFITSMSVSTLDPNRLHLSGRTMWSEPTVGRAGDVELYTELYNWRTEKTVGNWGSVSLEGSYTFSGTPDVSDIKLYSGSYLFVGATSGDGLYVLDVRNTASPARVNSSLSLGLGVYQMAIFGDLLFLVTDDANAELQVFDISNPTGFTSADRKDTYNVQGSSRARSLLVSGNKLYMGAQVSGSAGHDELYVFSYSSGGLLSVAHTLNNDSAGINDIFLSGTAAYLASTMDTGELQVATISGGVLTDLGGYNLSDRTLDAVSVAGANSKLLLGTQRGSSISELVVLDLTDVVVPSPPPGPWYKEGSGAVLDIDTDVRGCVAFFAAESNKKALQIINMDNTSTLQELYSYDSSTGKGKATFYDPYRDRLFFGTESALLIFAPGATTGTCP